MGIIRNATMRLRGKTVRVKLFGYENKSGKFITTDSYVNETDLVNIGFFPEGPGWNDVKEVNDDGD